MSQNKIAKVVIPLAIGAWLLGIVVFRTGAPAVFEAIYIVAFVVAVPTVVFYLMAEQGWSTLAKRYRSTAPFTGTWQVCPTGQMATVSVDHPEFNQNRLRLVSTLRVGITPEAFYLSMLFSKVPLLGLFFPDVRIPWTAIAAARTYEAPGWFAPQRQPGAVIQAAYDPNYTGTFVELEVGQPPVFIQLPLPTLGDAASRLRLTPAEGPALVGG
ncbi:MAG: hypothetical protein ACRDFT_02290 [bacterium]